VHREDLMTPTDYAALPLLNHALQEDTAFRPDDLVSAVRRQRGARGESIPPLCVLEFDGDLTDKLVHRGEVRRCDQWHCFHTQMWLWPAKEPRCGIVARTIGGPYTVLVAEQMRVSGAEAIVGLASAGRIGRELPLPGIVIADEAVRDEGTSLHYLPPGATVRADAALAASLAKALERLDLPRRQGLVWTTDAPYRETQAQINQWASSGVLAVEMQAASLFAFGERQRVRTGLVAHVTNAVDHDGDSFHKGPEDADVEILACICEAFHRLTPPTGTVDAETLASWIGGSRPVVIVDVRNDEDRAVSAIAGSIHFNAQAALKAGDPTAMNALDVPRGSCVVTVCNSGRSAAEAARLLRRRGVDACSLERGMKGWPAQQR